MQFLHVEDAEVDESANESSKSKMSHKNESLRRLAD